MRRCGKYWHPGGPALFLLAIVVAAAYGCDDHEGSGGTLPADLVLVSEPSSLTLVPGAVGTLEFRLTDKDGRNRASDTLRFALVGPEGALAAEGGIAGATLLRGEGVTNTQGRLPVAVKAGGVGKFRVRASYSGGADQFVPVTVVRHGVGLAQAIVASTSPTAPASVEMRLYEGVPCVQLSVATAPPVEARNSHKMAFAGRWNLPTLEASRSYGLVAKGFDQSGTLVGFGCVGINGAQLLQSATASFVVPLAAIRVSLARRYEAASDFIGFSTASKAARDIASAWAQLSACPRDPAQIWLDCTLDALGPQTAATPLDCVAEADEGELGRLLAARRGLVSVDSPTCRGPTDPGGQPSADAQVYALFPKERSASMAALPMIAKAAAGLFSPVRFSSSLEILESSKSGVWVATHTARSFGFRVGETFFSVPLSDRPGRTSRFVLATSNEAQTQLSIATHGFALNVGKAAHVAFRTRMFTDQGFPADERAFLNEVFGQAVFGTGPGTSFRCAAMDALLCEQMGKAPGCLQAACTRGLDALAQLLTAGFDALSSNDLDLFLQGNAQLADRQVDGAIGGLGSLVPNGAPPGLWNVELRGSGGSTMLGGVWVAVRQQ